MKYILSTLAIILLFTAPSIAQIIIPKEKVNPNNAIQKLPKDKSPVVANIILVPGIEVYELPNFRGRKAPFIKNAQGKFDFPFPLDHVSIRVPNDLILYIKICFEFPSEYAYTSSQQDINLNYICGVRTDEKAYVEISLGGISTEVHNNDCTRFNGSIVTKMWEKGIIASESIENSMPARSSVLGNGQYVIGGYSQTLFRMGNWQHPLNTQYYNYDAFKLFVRNNNPVPIFPVKANNVPHEDSATRRQTIGHQYFCVGKNALREGRVKLEVKTQLTSSHKNCDLCNDYKDMVKMADAVTEYFPLNTRYDGGRIINASNRNFIAGPYQARPYERHPTRNEYVLNTYSDLVKNFRVHLIINGL